MKNSFTTLDNQQIFYRTWKTALPCDKVVIISHGFSEHSGRYAHVAEFLNGLGANVYALDHRGHGKSSGQRGFVSHFNQYVSDLKNFMALISSFESGKKIFLLGHSMGGLVVITYLLEGVNSLSGVILSSPLIKIMVKGATLKKIASRVLSVFKPSLALVNEVKRHLVMRDQKELLKTLNDPLMHECITPRLYTEMVRAGKYALKHAEKVNTDLLLIQAGDDHIVDKDLAVQFVKTTSGPKVIKVYDDFYHEVFNDIEKEKVFNDVGEWLRAR